MPQTPGQDAWNVNSIATPRHVPNDSFADTSSTATGAAGTGSGTGTVSGSDSDPWGSSGGFATTSSSGNTHLHILHYHILGAYDCTTFQWYEYIY
jgi:hypothetical protein